MEEEEIQIQMDDGVARREFVYLLASGRRSFVSGTQNEIVVS